MYIAQLEDHKLCSTPDPFTVINRGGGGGGTASALTSSWVSVPLLEVRYNKLQVAEQLHNCSSLPVRQQPEHRRRRPEPTARCVTVGNLLTTPTRHV